MAKFGTGIAAETIEVGPPSGIGDDANVEPEHARHAKRLCVASRQTKPLASPGVVRPRPQSDRHARAGEVDACAEETCVEEWIGARAVSSGR
jgi:hypothetical protein